MTPEGKSYVLQRLADAPTCEALRTVWESVAYEYQRDADILQMKNAMKETLCKAKR